MIASGMVLNAKDREEDLKHKCIVKLKYSELNKEAYEAILDIIRSV